MDKAQGNRTQYGVTAPAGFRAAAAQAGIKRARPDIALLVSDRDAVAAGVFTRNRIQGAHVPLCRERVSAGPIRAIAVNSGNANACNGPQGAADAIRMAAATAAALGVPESRVLVCSTGTIGIPMPMEKVERGLRDAAAALTPDGGPATARAIMTTDTVPKESVRALTVNGRPVHVGGMAKGSGMIEPNMATMLAFLTTDAAVEPGALKSCLSAAVADSFNRISVDGDQSCNDTVLFLANGVAGNRPLGPGHPDWPAFEQAVRDVTLELALKIVDDGEGATKRVTVRVTGAETPEDARRAARAIANSLLVKTSWTGCDPNWGRVIDAVGYSGANVIQDRVNIAYDELAAVRGGRRAPDVALTDLEAILRRREFSVNVDLGLGDATDWVYTCDCSQEYVKINSEYMT